MRRVDADVRADGNPHSHANRNPYSHTLTNLYADAHPNRYSQTCAHPYIHSNTHPYANRRADTNSSCLPNSPPNALSSKGSRTTL